MYGVWGMYGLGGPCYVGGLVRGCWRCVLAWVVLMCAGGVGFSCVVACVCVVLLGLFPGS